MTVLRKLAPIGSVKKKPTAEQAAAHEAAAAAAAEEEAADSEDELANEGAGGQTVVNTQKLNAKNNQFKQNQQFVPCTEEMFKPIVDFYGIQAPDGRPYSRDQFFGRTETVKSISFLPRTLCDLMEADLSDKRRMKVVHSGLQVFDRNTKTKQNVGCDYRLSFEGIGMLKPYMTKRVIMFNKTDMSVCVKHSSAAPGAQVRASGAGGGEREEGFDDDI